MLLALFEIYTVKRLVLLLGHDVIVFFTNLKQLVNKVKPETRLTRLNRKGLAQQFRINYWAISVVVLTNWR